MSSKNVDNNVRTAAWRISLWGVVTFALGTALAFGFLQRFLSTELQHRSDSWLVGELGVLSDVAEHTPNDKLHDIILREVAELAGREAPRDTATTQPLDRTVLFLMTDPADRPILHTGAGAQTAENAQRLKSGALNSAPADVTLPGFALPFRVAVAKLPSGHRLYLGLSTEYEHAVLRRLRMQFAAFWMALILLGGSILFLTTRQMLGRIRKVTATAASIGRNNLATRVPVSERRDEITQMASTFNQMLDRIQATVQQLHTMTDAIAHDVRSPITAIRGRLELALGAGTPQEKNDAIAFGVEEIDRLSNLLSTSLDISEGNAQALRLRKQTVNLSGLTADVLALYEPMFSEAGLTIRSEIQPDLRASVDSALVQRMYMNLLENAVKHLPNGATVNVHLFRDGSDAVLNLRDDGPGFPAKVLNRMFEPYVRGDDSRGRGLGMAFVAAVVRTHEGRVSAVNMPERGAQITIGLPRI